MFLRESQKEAMVCRNTECGRSFNEPIELSVSHADGSPETYRACPYCFSQVSLGDRAVKRKRSPSRELKKRPSETPPSALKEVLTVLKESAEEIEKSVPVGCVHFSGYLKTRPRDTPIPDECLTCAEIIECI